MHHSEGLGGNARKGVCVSKKRDLLPGGKMHSDLRKRKRKEKKRNGRRPRRRTNAERSILRGENEHTQKTI